MHSDGSGTRNPGLGFWKYRLEMGYKYNKAFLHFFQIFAIVDYFPPSAWSTPKELRNLEKSLKIPKIWQK